MTKESKEIKGKTSPQAYNKTAFVEAATSTKESIELQIVLTDGASYTKEEVNDLVNAWKRKEVRI